ncbi:MAG TPA: TSUP family transporter [Elusimicrobiota bacterium]|jgi:uncharacterized membrane protein YfcA|nr:TSUP family transporter [Elusimicrobiota bacterium]
MSAANLALLAAAVFFAGMVDALAGGGGLITLPAYLALGLHPALILGTNKLCSAIGTAASTARYARGLRFKPAGLAWAVGAALAASVLGARLALLLDPRWMRWVLLVSLPLVGAFVYGHGSLDQEDTSHARPRRVLLARTLSASAPIAAYDGFFGPGAGTFYALSLTRFCGYDILRATAFAKILNLSSNLAALVTFLIAGRVDVRLGLAMSVASVGGNALGASLGLRRGRGAIRPAMLAVLAGLFLKLLVAG